jgi:hypothetical protein
MRCLALLVLVLAAVGCTTTSDVKRLDNTARAPTLQSDVAVLVEEPSRPYSVIAKVEVSDQGWGLSFEDLKQKMQREAAAIGGDAVIIGTEATLSGTDFVPIGDTVFGVDDVEKKLIGKVIVYTGGQ